MRATSQKFNKVVVVYSLGFLNIFLVLLQANTLGSGDPFQIMNTFKRSCKILVLLPLFTNEPLTVRISWADNCRRGSLNGST